MKVVHEVNGIAVVLPKVMSIGKPIELTNNFYSHTFSVAMEGDINGLVFYFKNVEDCKASRASLIKSVDNYHIGVLAYLNRIKE